MKKNQSKIAYILSFLAICLFSTTITFAQGKVDFSGKWKINESKSKFNEQFSAHPEEVNITQSGNDLMVERIGSMMGGQSYDLKDKFTLDGKDCTNTGPMNNDEVSNARWSSDGNTIMITTKVTTDNGDFDMNRNMKMDGSSLVVDFTMKGGFGENSETWVFDKE